MGKPVRCAGSKKTLYLTDFRPLPIYRDINNTVFKSIIDFFFFFFLSINWHFFIFFTSYNLWIVGVNGIDWSFGPKFHYFGSIELKLKIMCEVDCCWRLAKLCDLEVRLYCFWLVPLEILILQIWICNRLEVQSLKIGK